MTLDQLTYFEDKIFEHISNYPDEVVTWLSRFAMIVEFRSAAVNTTHLVLTSSDIKTLNSWFEELKEVWPMQWYGPEDELYYGGNK